MLVLGLTHGWFGITLAAVIATQKLRLEPAHALHQGRAAQDTPATVVRREVLGKLRERFSEDDVIVARIWGSYDWSARTDGRFLRARLTERLGEQQPRPAKTTLCADFRALGSIWQEKPDRSPSLPAPAGWAGATMPASPPGIVAHVKEAGELPVYGLIISWRHGGAPGASRSARHHSCQVNSRTAPSQCQPALTPPYSAPSLSSGARPGCAGGPGQTASSTRSRRSKCRRAPGSAAPWSERQSATGHHPATV